MKMTEQELLYWQEFQKIRSGGGGLRTFIIISAILEAHIFSIAFKFTKREGRKFQPPEGAEFKYCWDIIEKHDILGDKELLLLKDFRKARKFIVHDSFKLGASREKLDKTIKEGNCIGKELVLQLHSKLIK